MFPTQRRTENRAHSRLRCTAAPPTPNTFKQGITVAEVTGSNVVSVAEHVVMMILSLVRNYMTGYNQAR